MYKFLKVVFDVLLALIALACVSWLLLPCMLILWCTGEHKVWYLQKRVGCTTFANTACCACNKSNFIHIL